MDDKKTRTDSPGLNESWQKDRASLRHLMASKQADAGNNGDEEEKISVSKSHHFSLPYPRSAIPTRHKETDGQYNSYTEGNFHGTHRNEREKDDKLGQDTAEPQPEAKKKRKLNYLSESARVDIVDRIERGERQSDLAKEFGVTRAAICYLNKNRDGIRSKCWRAAAEKTNSSYTRSESATEILPHRVNKFHLHGNSERGSPSSLKSYERLGPQRVIGPLRHHHKYRVYEIKTLPMLMHFSMMRSKMRNPVSFRHAANRATRYDRTSLHHLSG
jgi:predicted transcriptional regulator